MDRFIVQVKNAVRPCMVKNLVNGKKHRALFHRWADVADVVPQGIMISSKPSYQVWDVFGIVENECGTVETVEPHAIEFLDTDEVMSEFELGDDDK